MRDNTKLRAFVLANEAAILTYRETRKFPKAEIWGLTSQMRRTAVSVPPNIVEGCARESRVEFLRFLEIAFSSLRELHYQFGLSKHIGYLHENNYTGRKLKRGESEKVLGALVLYATLTGYSLNHLSSYKTSIAMLIPSQHCSSKITAGNTF